MARHAGHSNYTLEVHLDASGVEDRDPSRAVKVLAIDEKGEARSSVTRFDKAGQARAEIGFAEPPGTVRVVVGPEDADDGELPGLQTLTATVSARQWAGKDRVVLAPIAVTTFYWHWWLRWCQTYVVRGRVLCPDGTPVPGAVVTAFDTDFWWWWCSKQDVATATTDASGTFEMKFRWCCGWWPWWWWALRRWEVEPHLAEQIQPVLHRELKLKRPPIPDPDPDPAVFERLVGRAGPVGRPVSPADPHDHDHGDLRHGAAAPALAKATFDPTTLEALRHKVAEVVPAPAALERLKLWPWFPWYPWWDCAPDLIFRATQNCDGTNKVIVDETCFDTRFDVPTELEVTLVAEGACCASPPPDCSSGNCVELTHACEVTADHIGGNTAAPATPAGFANPGGAGVGGDRPFAGSIVIGGTAQCMEGVDYYEFLWSTDGVTWNDMPVGAMGAFGRSWIDLTNSPDVEWGHPSFAPVPLSGRWVYPTLPFYEAANPAGWGVSRLWIDATRDRLGNWLTNATTWADGLYHLRVQGWNFDAASGQLVDGRILNVCGSDEPAEIVLFLDNRLVGPASGHPGGVPDHPVTPLHIQTPEPDTDFLQVQLVHPDGTSTVVEACSLVAVGPGDDLVVDFMAHDPDGHLGDYSLRVTWGENQLTDLLDTTLSGFSLVPSPIAAPVPPASPVGPSYPGGPAAPIWEGGAVRLTVDASEAFPETCAYQLELVATKRTIVDCSGEPHRNSSVYSFTITVP